MPDDQAAWVDQLRNREEPAVRALIGCYGAPLARFLTGMVGNDADAEDLAQEAMIRLVDHVADFRGEASLKTYLFKIAHNLALNHLASSARRREVQPEEGTDPPAHAPSPHSEASAAEEAALLRATLALLPPQQRAVVVLRTWQDLSFREIASVLSLAEGTVKAHYFFALKNLRRLMEAAP